MDGPRRRPRLPASRASAPGSLRQGPGIPAEDLERVFERFYSRGTVQGAGLGLAIVQSIARRHAGQIRLRNLDSGGLQASLELPRSA